MKRLGIFATLLLSALLLLTGCGKDKASPSPSAPVSASSAPSASAAPASPDKAKDGEDSQDAPGQADSQVKSSEADDEEEDDEPEGQASAQKNTETSNAAAREEIRRMLADAEDLIDEGLLDDANMILRNLRTHDLTDEEKAQVDELQARMVTISD